MNLSTWKREMLRMLGQVADSSTDAIEVVRNDVGNLALLRKDGSQVGYIDVLFPELVYFRGKE